LTLGQSRRPEEILRSGKEQRRTNFAETQQGNRRRLYHRERYRCAGSVEGGKVIFRPGIDLKEMLATLKYEKAK
jgi:hypothetical protein